MESCDGRLDRWLLPERRVLLVLAAYSDRHELFAEYPELQEEDIKQALAFSAANLDDRVATIDVA